MPKIFFVWHEIIFEKFACNLKIGLYNADIITTEETMNEMLILESLNDCKTRNDVENLWTATYLQYRDNAWKVWKHFEERRSEVIHTVQVFSESYKANGWD